MTKISMLILTVCMINSVAHAMDEEYRRAYFQQGISNFYAQNPKKIWIIGGKVYTDPEAPEVKAAQEARQKAIADAQAAYEQWQQEQEAQAQLAREQLAREAQERLQAETFRQRGFVPLSLNTDFDEFYPGRYSDQASRLSNKEN